MEFLKFLSEWFEYFSPGLLPHRSRFHRFVVSVSYAYPLLWMVHDSLCVTFISPSPLLFGVPKRQSEMFYKAVIHNFFRFNVALKRRMSNYGIPKKVDPRFKNPCSELQQFVEEPLFKEDELSFNPTIEDMKLAQKLFMPVNQHEIKYITSLSDIDTFPHHNLPEVTFIGRNNVGKSSLLRALFVRVPGLVLKTSKKPVSNFD
ncbi:UNVERIFIED_CONTAM: Gtpbp8 [Trichonephila clavipes]